MAFPVIKCEWNLSHVPVVSFAGIGAYFFLDVWPKMNLTLFMWRGSSGLCIFFCEWHIKGFTESVVPIFGASNIQTNPYGVHRK